MSSTRSCLFRDVCLLNLTAVSYFTIHTIFTKKTKRKWKKEIQSQYFSIYKFVWWFAIIFLHQLIHVLLLMQCTLLITCISCLHRLCWKNFIWMSQILVSYNFWLVNWLFNFLEISNILVRGWPYSVCVWDMAYPKI